nr:MAG TPA: hypothetical protein [Caudoviricetes sp.]
MIYFVFSVLKRCAIMRWVQSETQRNKKNNSSKDSRLLLK